MTDDQFGSVISHQIVGSAVRTEVSGRMVRTAEPTWRLQGSRASLLRSSVTDGLAKQEGRVPLVFPSKHPVVHHKIAALRATATRPSEFRCLVRSLAILLAQEATADLPALSVAVTTPLGEASGLVLADTIGI